MMLPGALVWTVVQDWTFPACGLGGVVLFLVAFVAFILYLEDRDIRAGIVGVVSSLGFIVLAVYAWGLMPVGWQVDEANYTIAGGNLPVYGPQGWVWGSFALGFGVVEGRVTTEACVSVIYQEGGLRSYTCPINDADIRDAPGLGPTIRVSDHYRVLRNGKLAYNATSYTVYFDFERLLAALPQVG